MRIDETRRGNSLPPVSELLVRNGGGGEEHIEDLEFRERENSLGKRQTIKMRETGQKEARIK